jgi:hypothetical protein
MGVFPSSWCSIYSVGAVQSNQTMKFLSCGNGTVDKLAAAVFLFIWLLTLIAKWLSYGRSYWQTIFRRSQFYGHAIRIRRCQWLPYS